MIAFLPASARRLVSDALLPLTVVDAGLCARAVDYVLNGTQPEVLREVTTKGRDPADCLVLATSNASYTHWYGRTWLRSLQEEAGIRWKRGDGSAGPLLTRRDALYRGRSVLPDQWVRLGRLLAAVLTWQIGRASCRERV